MNHDRDGGLVVLDHEVRRLQQELTELERRPERLDPLREILRSVQRLRHAADADEPRPVRLLRNAVEKVTLHVGRSRPAVTPEVLDFYVDTVDLLEDAVRRWPAGADFDPRRRSSSPSSSRRCRRSHRSSPRLGGEETPSRAPAEVRRAHTSYSPYRTRSTG